MRDVSGPVSLAWLPSAALAGNSFLQHLLEPIEGWWRRWIARDPNWSIEGPERAPVSRAVDEPAGWKVVAPGLWLRVAPESRTALSGLVLGAPIERERLTAPDRQLIDRLMDLALEDLTRDFADLFQAAAPERDRADPLWVFSLVATDAGVLIEVAAGEERLVALRKRLCRPAATLPALQPLSEGLSKQAVSLSAFLGDCRLSLAEFSDLAEGDVVLLEGDVTQPLPLAVAEAGARFGACLLEPTDQGYRLKVVQTQSE